MRRPREGAHRLVNSDTRFELQFEPGACGLSDATTRVSIEAAVRAAPSRPRRLALVQQLQVPVLESSQVLVLLGGPAE